jgi:hypothetical protein
LLVGLLQLLEEFSRFGAGFDVAFLLCGWSVSFGAQITGSLRAAVSHGPGRAVEFAGCLEVPVGRCTQPCVGAALNQLELGKALAHHLGAPLYSV